MISLLVPLHSHLPWRGAVSLVDDGLHNNKKNHKGALCAPLWFYNEDFEILNTLRLEMCCTCLVFNFREIF